MARDYEWQLKRYAILAAEKELDNSIASSALTEAYIRLPYARRLENEVATMELEFKLSILQKQQPVFPVFYGSGVAFLHTLRKKICSTQH